VPLCLCGYLNGREKSHKGTKTQKKFSNPESNIPDEPKKKYYPAKHSKLNDMSGTVLCAFVSLWLS
jgi:hypothetical protein